MTNPHEYPLATLFSPCSPHLRMALKAMSTNNLITAIQHITTGLDLPTLLQGERQTILKFLDEPLASGLRLTEGKRTCITDLFDGSAVGGGSVYVHEVHGTREFCIEGEEDLERVARYILECRDAQQKGLRSGFLRPRPQTDDVLLELLQSPNYGGNLRFKECGRAVERGCLLDATVELLTPFGLQPKESDGDTVVLMSKRLQADEYYPSVKVTRMKEYLSPWPEDKDSDSSYDSQVDVFCSSIDVHACVVISGLRTSNKALAATDRNRFLPTVLRATGNFSELGAAEMPYKALVYDLSKQHELRALVERILALKAEVLADELPFEFRRWIGRQRHYETPDVPKRVQKRLDALLHTSVLPNEVTVEYLHEQDAKEAARLEKNGLALKLCLENREVEEQSLESSQGAEQSLQDSRTEEPSQEWKQETQGAENDKKEEAEKQGQEREQEVQKSADNDEEKKCSWKDFVHDYNDYCNDRLEK